LNWSGDVKLDFYFFVSCGFGDGKKVVIDFVERSVE